jgi:hypothetical protein
MRGKVDENIPIESADVLRTAGWECDTVFEEALSGAEDPDVAARCRHSRISSARVCRHRGLPPVKPSRDSVLALLKQLIPVLSAEWAERRLWIVEPGRVRIREGGSPAV